MNLHNKIQTNIISYNEISKFFQNNNILALNLQNENQTQLLFPLHLNFRNISHRQYSVSLCSEIL